MRNFTTFQNGANLRMDVQRLEFFYQGKTYTYEELPPFPENKTKERKPKTIHRKKIVTESEACSDIPSAPESTLCDNILPVSVAISVDNVLQTSVLNPLANPFNYILKDDEDSRTTLRKLRVTNIGNIIIAHLNINSLRYKFDSLVELIQSNLDILVIRETKLDESFPDAQFKINGFKW